ncbi:hypothetical protein ACFQQB_23485 [Nonomuraea rubra]|uniref:hypothetical protein n=1 Tax=Nonomuraea rubra TaxID=46180 RepID=UPI00360A48AA
MLLIDPGKIGQGLSYRLVGGYVELTEQQPTPASAPAPVPEPDVGAGAGSTWRTASNGGCSSASRSAAGCC